MSEGQPKQSPSPTPEGGQARSVPIQEEDGVAPVDDINSLAPNVSGTNYVMDKDKAEAMAYAETDFRTKAAKNRAAVYKPEEFDDKLTKLQDEASEIKDAYGRTSFWSPSRKALNRRTDEIYRKFGELNKKKFADREKSREADLATSRQFREDFPVPHVEDAHAFATHADDSPDERASFYDRQAARIGEWASALHDHPLSVEFKKDHPGVQFQPKRLMRMEDEVETLELKIRRAEEAPHDRVGTLVRTELLGDGSRRFTEVQQLLLKAGDKEKDEEYEKLAGHLVEQAEAFDKLHARLDDEVSIQPLRDRSALIRNLLNDVRREVGLPVEEVESETAAQDQSAEVQPKAEPETAQS